jgi:hypothetical protein
MRKPRVIFGIFALSLASTSCLRQKTQARVFTPPPARAWPVVADTAPDLPEAPQFATDGASMAPPQLPQIIDLTPEIPEAPKRAERRPVPSVIAPKPPTAGPPPTAAPRLSQILTPAEQRENTRTLDESLNRVNRILTIVDGKNLSPAQKEIADRIRTFRKQAEQAARDQDLITAVSLARRADLLAKDLLDHL